MGPIIGGALIGAAGNLLGGIIGSEGASKDRKLQKEFAQQGIRWRVEDAKAAGLHPLAALGAQIPQYSPVGDGGLGASISDAGNNVARAAMATTTASEKTIQAAQLANLKAQTAESDARRGLIESEIARNLDANIGSIIQGANWNSDIYPHSVDVSKPRADTAMVGGVEHKAPVVPNIANAADPSMMAGRPALWREFQYAPGIKIALPGGIQGDAAEVLESVSESVPLMLAVFEETKRRYGSKNANALLDRVLGFHIPSYDEINQHGQSFRRKYLSRDHSRPTHHFPAY